ncbi:MAG: AarF/ABC1/UbiB kinase family protein [Chloroflexi bacterium]|nr:AarF/ABC1/UbiB kinase family protein [Chloroflexota bacterium]
MVAFWKRPFVELIRARHIAEVLVRNGLGMLAEQFGLQRFLPRNYKTDIAEGFANLTPPQRLRKMLEELGPTFIKLGQILSTRPDILPPDYIVELTKLLDAAPAASADALCRIIEAELSAPIEQLFRSFDPIPLGVASIGQVHAAELLDGTPVVVKIQKPNVEEKVRADLDILRTQTRFLQRNSKVLARYQIAELAEEFAQALSDELDYTVEGRNAEQLHTVYSRDEVAIPRIHWVLTTRRVITMDRLEGIPLNEPERLKDSGLTGQQIAEHVVAIYLEQIFRYGVFHADPHPANILVMGEGIGLVDFGSVGYISTAMRDELVSLLAALSARRASGIVDVIMRLGITDQVTNRARLESEIQRLMPRYYGASIQGFPMSQFLVDVMSISFKQHIRLPSDLVLLARAMMVLEGVVVGLDPTINLAAHVEPFARRLMRDQLSFANQLKEGYFTLQELRRLMTVLPARAEEISTQLEDGKLTLGVNIHRLEPVMQKMASMANRLALSLVLASMIIGTALVAAFGNNLTLPIPFTRIRIPYEQIGIISILLVAGWVTISLFRSHKRL